MNKDRHAEYDFATIVDISGFKQFLNEANLPLLSYEQEKELAARIAKGDEEARNQLILSNLRWVVKLATRYTRDQVSIEDLFQEGIFGLLRAVEKYNPARGRFSTYATWWIRQTMIRSIDEMEQPIHMPVYQVELLRRFKNVINRFVTEQGREPTVDELAEQLHFSLKQIHFLQECESQLVISLDRPTTDDDHEHLRDLLEDPETVESILEERELSDQQKLFREALKMCTERERLVISLRYGLGDGRSRTLLEVGRELGISRERVRQLEEKALQKVKAYVYEQQAKVGKEAA